MLRIVTRASCLSSLLASFLHEPLPSFVIIGAMFNDVIINGVCGAVARQFKIVTEEVPSQLAGCLNYMKSNNILKFNKLYRLYFITSA